MDEMVEEGARLQRQWFDRARLEAAQQKSPWQEVFTQAQNNAERLAYEERAEADRLEAVAKLKAQRDASEAQGAPPCHLVPTGAVMASLQALLSAQPGYVEAVRPDPLDLDALADKVAMRFHSMLVNPATGGRPTPAAEMLRRAVLAIVKADQPKPPHPGQALARAIGRT